jgi:hypothetical protein
MTDHVGALDADRVSYLPVQSRPLYDARLGTFHQLDLRIDKSLDALLSSGGRKLKLTAYLDIQNVYFIRAQEGISYNYNYTQSNPVLSLPILPIVGLRGDL